MKKANMGFFIINCMHWQFQEALVFRVQLSPLFESRCSWNLLREAINLLREAICICFSDAGKKKKNKYHCRMFQTPNRTEIDQEPQEPKPNMNRTGPIANTRNRNRTEPKPHCIMEKKHVWNHQPVNSWKAQQRITLNVLIEPKIQHSHQP